MKRCVAVNAGFVLALVLCASGAHAQQLREEIELLVGASGFNSQTILQINDQIEVNSDDGTALSTAPGTLANGTEVASALADSRLVVGGVGAIVPLVNTSGSGITLVHSEGSYVAALSETAGGTTATVLPPVEPTTNLFVATYSVFVETTGFALAVSTINHNGVDKALVLAGNGFFLAIYTDTDANGVEFTTAAFGSGFVAAKFFVNPGDQVGTLHNCWTFDAAFNGTSGSSYSTMESVRVLGFNANANRFP